MGHSTAFVTDRLMHVADDQLRAAAKALSGPERLAVNDQASRDRGRIAAAPEAMPPTATPAVAREAGVQAGIAQVVEATMRRGAGVAEQGCLLSSYTR
jgi:hypothetical protein